jgi:DNA-binding beta-propeller fold protein YncE
MNRMHRILPLALAGLALACSDSEATCPESNRVCETVCVDTRIDPNHCGGCDIACGAGFVCKDSACVCPAHETPCTNGCVDTATDPNHCGGCNLACGAAEVCQEGQCVPCTGEGCSCETCGGETCVDLRADEANCGTCGQACPSGTSCLNGTCAVGDLYVACMGAGTVRPFLRAGLTAGAPDAIGIGSPQSLALLPPDHLLVAGTMDDRLWVFDRATMASVAFAELGASAVANQVLVREGRAYVIESGTNTVQVVDLSNPAAPALVDEVSTGEGSNPYGAAFADDGTLWVSLWVSGQVVAIPFAASEPAAGTPVAVPTDGLEGSPYPAGVAVRGNTVYVTLNNLGGDFKPAGNGRLALFDRVTGEARGAPIDLGAGCKNPGFPAVAGTDLWIPCGGTLDENWVSNDDGALVRFDTATDTVAATVATGRAPGRLSVLPDGTVFASNNGGLGFLVVDPAGGVQSVDACPAGAFEFVADVLAVP